MDSRVCIAGGVSGLARILFVYQSAGEGEAWLVWSSRPVSMPCGMYDDPTWGGGGGATFWLPEWG